MCKYIHKYIHIHICIYIYIYICIYIHVCIRTSYLWSIRKLFKSQILKSGLFLFLNRMRGCWQHGHTCAQRERTLATDCNRLQQTVTDCNRLQQTAAH